MPYTARFELIDFEIDRPDESGGDEPYLIVVYWALDGNITLGDDGTLVGTPQMEFRGGDHKNIARRSLNASDGRMPVPDVVGDVTMRLLEFDPTLPDLFGPIEPVVGLTVIAMEEDNTPDRWVNDIMADVRTGIPPFAASFIQGLNVADLISPAARNAAIAAFESAVRDEITSIATKSIARKIGRSLLFGFFQLADRDDEIGRATRWTMGSMAAPVTATHRLVLEQRPSGSGGGLAGGAGSSSPSARYVVNARIEVTHEPPTTPPLFVEIDFFGRDDDATDELLDPGPSAFPIEPSRPVSRAFRWGGELRVEYDFRVEVNDGGDAFLTVNGRLYEGTHELNNDLDASGSVTVAARSNTRNVGRLVLENDEWRSDDAGRLDITLRNGV